MLAGLLRPTEGGIKIDGRDVSKMSEKERTAFRRRRSVSLSRRTTWCRS